MNVKLGSQLLNTLNATVHSQIFKKTGGLKEKKMDRSTSPE